MSHDRTRFRSQPEASIYLACDAGVTPAQIVDRLRAMRGASCDASAAPGVDEVRALLDELVAEGLVYEEQGKYLALSTAQTPRAEDADGSAGGSAGDSADDAGDIGGDVGLIRRVARRAS